MNGRTGIAGKTLQRKIDSQLPPKESIETVLVRTANLKRSDCMQGNCGPKHRCNPLLGEVGQGDSSLKLAVKLVRLVCSM
jgi:hypothetical protein